MDDIENINYSVGAFNDSTWQFQAIRLSEGCPHKCDWCYEWRIIGKNWKVFDIPRIIRNDVHILDMNFLAKPECIDLMKRLGQIKYDNKGVYYWLVCGIDYRFLTQEISDLLKVNRFVKIHIAWDGSYKDQKKIKNAIKILRKSGHRNLSLFMICNHKFISYEENLQKLNLCKYWNIKVNDCWFDNQVSPHIKPVAWTIDQIKSFRKQVRKHNQFIVFGIDPELKDCKN